MTPDTAHKTRTSGSCLRGLARLITVSLLAITLAGCGQVSHTAEEHLERGLAFEHQNDFAAAAIEYRNTLTKDPENAEARFRLGMLMLRQGEAANAELEFKRAQDHGWNQDDLHLPRLRAALLQAQYGRIMDATRSLEHLPEEQVADALAIRGLALVNMGNSQEARRIFDQALDRDPKLLNALIGMAVSGSSLGEGIDASRRWLDRALEVDPHSRDAWAFKGDLEHGARRYDEADAAFTKAIEQSPNPYFLHFKRAITRISKRDLAGAEQDLAILRRLGAGQPTTSYVEGLIHYENARFDEAQAALQTTLSRAPAFDQAIFFLGVVHWAQGNWEQADHNLNRFLARNPGSEDAARLLANVRLRQTFPAQASTLLDPLLDGIESSGSMGNLQLARDGQTTDIDQLRRLAAAQPGNDALQGLLVRELLQAGELDEGIRELEAMVGETPEVSPMEAALIVGLLRSGEADRALDAAVRLIQRAPEDPVSHNLKSAVHFARGELAEGVESLNEALALDPGNTSATLVLGQLARAEGKPQEERRLYENALAHYPSHLGVLMQFSQMEVNQGNPGAAARLLERAVREHPMALDPRLSLANYHLRRDEPAQTVALLEPLQDTEHGNNLRVLDLLARAQLAAGQQTQALATLRRFAAQTPDDAGVRLRLAAMLIRADGLPDAREQVEQVLAEQPGHLEALRLLAGLEQELGRLDAAIAVAQRMQDAAPETADGHVLEARLASAAGREEDAIRAWQTAYEISPVTDIALALARAYQGAGQTDQAAKLLRERLATHPDESATRALYAAAMLQAGEYASAQKEFEHLRAAHPENAAVLNNLAWIYQRQGDPRALETAEQALALEPDNAAIQDTLGWILLQQGDAERGLDLIKGARQALPDDLQIRYHYAYGLAATGRTADAREELTALLDSPEAFEARSAAEELLQQLQ